jgi:two-component system sensor histidine kinase QseC
MTSIRNYLTRRLLIGLALLLILSQVVLYWFVSTRSISQFDASLTMTARVVAELTRQTPSQIRLLSSVYELVPDFLRDHGDYYFQLWIAGNEVIERSHSLNRKDLPRRVGTRLNPVHWKFELPDGRPARGIGFRFVPEHSGFSHRLLRPTWEEEEAPPVKYEIPQEVDFVLARECEDLNRTLSTLWMGCLGVSGFILIGIGFLIPNTLDTGLLPLTDLARQAETIDPGSLSSRFPTSRLPSEILPITTQLNRLLERLEVAFQREKRLTADMAHELKTPISELQTLTQVALKWPGDEEFLLDTIRDAFDISRQMKDKVSTLLALARCDSGQQSVSLSPVALPDLVREHWDRWIEPAHGKEIQTELEIDEETMEVISDEHLLSSILTNLLSNAVEYCPSKGRLGCHLRNNGEGAKLTLENTNRTLTESDLPHLFDPFWRKDVARTDGAHSGLGLTLIQTYAFILGIRVRFRLTEMGDFMAVMEIPREFRPKPEEVKS